MSDRDIQLELYGRLFVQMVNAGILPGSILASMESEFSDLAAAAGREEDRRHFEQLGFHTGLLITRANFGDPTAAAVSEDRAQAARGKFRVIENPAAIRSTSDGGNDPA